MREMPSRLLQGIIYTSRGPFVYMQNSGLGNAINPLVSLCDLDVYSIPMIILVGWRGEPGIHDEPQHKKQGKIQLDLIRSLDIPYAILSKDEKDLETEITKYVKTAQNRSTPFIILAKKNTFSIYPKKESLIQNSNLSREKALEALIDNLPEDSIIVSTTGKVSREIYEIREERGESHSKDFLTVGSMGHCSSIALGILISMPERKVVVLMVMFCSARVLSMMGILVQLTSTCTNK